MDLVLACRVFVHVAERSSFTDGAAAAGVPQPVASRRVAALESRLGRRLFDRSTRRTALTPFGADVLPSARRLVELADALDHDAERARLRPLAVAVPDTCSTRALAVLQVAARRAGTVVELVPAAHGRRVELMRSRQVRAAIVPAPPAEATWRTPLGLGSQEHLPGAHARLAVLRPSRARGSGHRRLWLQPEDDVPHVRDAVRRAGHASGLSPAQVAVAPTLAAGTAAAMGGTDLLLCSAAQAAELGLCWQELREPTLVRGHAPQGGDRDDVAVLGGPLHAAVALALGVHGATTEAPVPAARTTTAPGAAIASQGR